MVGSKHPLVDYPSSDEDDSSSPPAKEQFSLKRKRDDLSDLPPLPSRFHDLYASASRVSTRDVPSLHDGRKRVIPHIEGNWPAHIYIDWYPSETEDASLTKLIAALQERIPVEPGSKVHSLVTSDMGVPLPLHQGDESVWNPALRYLVRWSQMGCKFRGHPLVLSTTNSATKRRWAE